MQQCLYVENGSASILRGVCADFCSFDAVLSEKSTSEGEIERGAETASRCVFPPRAHHFGNPHAASSGQPPRAWLDQIIRLIGARVIALHWSRRPFPNPCHDSLLLLRLLATSSFSLLPHWCLKVSGVTICNAGIRRYPFFPPFSFLGKLDYIWRTTASSLAASSFGNLLVGKLHLVVSFPKLFFQKRETIFPLTFTRNLLICGT